MIYLATGLVLLAVAYVAVGSSWQSSPGVHTGMELTASLLAAFVGVIALIRYYSRKHLSYLLIATGFLGAGLFDAFHMATSSIHFVPGATDPLPAVAAWGWFAGRVFLAALLVAAIWMPARIQAGERRPIDIVLYAATTIVAVAVFFYVYLAELPRSYFPDNALIRPYEILPGLLFLVATVGLWREGSWRTQSFEHWLLLALIVSAASQLVIAPFIPRPFSPAFDLTHILKLASYGLVLVGLVASMQMLLRETERREDQMVRLNARLTQEVTRRADAEGDLENQKNELEAILDGMAEGVVFADRTGRVIRANEGARKILGQDLIGEPEGYMAQIEIYADDEKTRLHFQDTGLGHAIRGETIDDRLLWLKTAARPDGFFVRSSARPVRDENGEVDGGVVVFHDVTEEERSHRAVAEREERLQALVSTAQDAIISIDRDSQVLEFNPAAEELFGWAAAEIIGKPVMRLMPERFRHRHLEGMERYARSGRGLLVGNTVELVALHRTGEEIPVELSLGVWRIGGDACFTGILRDIRARKEAEHRLRESEETYRAMVSEVQDYAIFRVDPEGHIQTWNEGAARHTGYSREEAIGLHFSTFFTEEARQAGLPQSLLEEAKEGRSEDRGWRVRKDGSHYFVRSVITRITDADGRILGYTKITHDRTKEREAEELLRASEERYRLLADNASDLIIVHEHDGTVDYASPAALPITGYAPEELRGKSLLPLLDERDRRRLRERLQRVVAEEESTRETIRLERKDGRIIWLECLMRWLDGSADHADQVLATYRDVTGRMQAQVALERSNAELQEFAHIASHDLKEPLRKVIAFGDRLKMRHADDLGQEGVDHLERMQSAAQRMRGLLDDLLAYSRVTSRAEPPQPVDMGDIAAQVIEDLSEQVRETGGTVHVGRMPRLRGDPTQMRQALQNLVSNALKYHKQDEPPRVRVEGGVEGPQAWFAVADEGIGFDMSQAERIFRPFQRLHGRSEYSGSGIGLAIVRKIIERHGGSIEAESEPGSGSRFVVRIPIGEAHDPPPLTTEATSDD